MQSEMKIWKTPKRQVFTDSDFPKKRQKLHIGVFSLKSRLSRKSIVIRQLIVLHLPLISHYYPFILFMYYSLHCDIHCMIKFLEIYGEHVKFVFLYTLR